MSPEFQDRLSALHDTFDLLDDWELRLQHVIDLGKNLPALAPGDRTDATRVLGCASKVWLVIDGPADGHLHFRAESDAFIVRGLIAILMELLNGLPFSDVLGFDVRATLTALNLADNLGSQRTNGLLSMVERLKRAAI